MKQARNVKDTKSFINYCLSKFGENRFDYSKVEYKTAKTEVDIRCIKHDLWFRTQPYSHHSGNGSCPECRREGLGQYNRLLVEDFIVRSSVLHNNKYDYSLVSEFKNAHNNVVIICPVHAEFTQSVNNHLYNGFGCPTCGDIQAGLSSRLSQEEVLQRFIEKHGDSYDYSEVVYEGIYSPVKIYCKEHDNWFYQKPTDHSTGTGCKLCIDKGYSREKAGYLYINKVGDNKAIKVGITNVCPIARAKVLTRKSALYHIEPLFYFYHEDGGFIDDLESDILNRFPTGIIPRNEMTSGYTETISCEYLPEIIDIVVYKFNNYKPA